MTLILRWRLIVFVLLVVPFSAYAQKTAKAAPRKATLAQQKMCADQAAKVFREEESPRDNNAVTFRAHYDGEDNICYIRTHKSWKTPDGTWMRHVYVTDAFERTLYASLLRSARSGTTTRYSRCARLYCFCGQSRRRALSEWHRLCE